MRDDRPPLLSLVFGYGPALLLLAIGIAAWTVSGPHLVWIETAGRLWAAAILLFLAGVRRGLSFFTPGGPRPAQVVTSIGLFVLGLASFVADRFVALGLLTVGYLAVAVLDPIAAKSGDVPAHFRRLRPPQMAIFVAGLALLALRLLRP